ncbi:Srb4p [Sugiyamaella lignohabitans]|uniref:Mediator of RNA polymerase II transcription subunit 17 n=1 Tax=Sugiyamaella lignohabitans TaxID=796027 RepID=A0A167D505_9ASCO|nr:Srb4p [Sugiyamaella lignohabitans]ANB12486.1 Srb4p [Sugiyamaella lignohabitans]
MEMDVDEEEQESPNEESKDQNASKDADPTAIAKESTETETKEEEGTGDADAVETAAVGPMSSKDFEQARIELVQLIRTAQNESALSLDFVSLLLSCLRPAAGTTSMSPHLKQHVAVGSLGADALWIQPQEEDPIVGAGWKVQSLGEASKQLKNAASRLRGEVVKEKKYWDAVMKTVVNDGEVMFKIRRGDARGLGLKYGFGDSGSEYRDKGLAMVRRKPDGELSFRFDRTKQRKAVRVVLYDITSGEKVPIGTSTPASLLVEDRVENEIKNARMILFEEELFFEMVQEARLLSSYKITVSDNVISVNLFDELLEIEYADLSHTHPAEGLPQLKADLICNALHILLSYSHKRRLEKRRAVPAPLTKT